MATNGGYLTITHKAWCVDVRRVNAHNNIPYYAQTEYSQNRQKWKFFIYTVRNQDTKSNPSEQIPHDNTGSSTDISDVEREWKVQFNQWKNHYIVDWKNQFDNFLNNYERRLQSCGGAP